MNSVGVTLWLPTVSAVAWVCIKPLFTKISPMKMTTRTMATAEPMALRIFFAFAGVMGFLFCFFFCFFTVSLFASASRSSRRRRFSLDALIVGSVLSCS